MPEKLYVARVNLSGLYWNKPVVVYKEPDENWYASKDGNLVLDPEKPMISPTLGHITYFSADRKDVENWIAGASAVMRMVHHWSKGFEPAPKKKKKAKR